MKKPTFSVIMAVHNGATTIGRAIDSILAQSYSPMEIIVVDDGSTDNTSEEVARFGGAVLYLSQPHAGVSAARNAGASMATGEWLAFLDADDWYYPDRLRWHAEWIEEDRSLDFLTGDFDYKGADGKFLRRSMESTEAGRRMLKKAKGADRVLMTAAELESFVAQHFGDTHTLSVPRETFFELGGYPLGVRVCEDVHFLIRLCGRSRRVGVICRAMAVYTVHPGSATRRDPLNAQEETVRALEQLTPLLMDSPSSIRSGLRECMRHARLDLAYVLLRNGRRMGAIRAVLPLVLARPSWRSLRDFVSVMRGGSS
jgi:glycosyltransferase involved in cell wall biosynthesis